MINDFVIDKLQDEALSYLGENLDKHYTYHNAEHSLEVCNAVKLFTEKSDLPDFTIAALRIAAIFHDFGYLIRSNENEALAWEYIQEFGSRSNIDRKYLLAAHELILETVYPYKPQTPAGEILCDADIEYIGREGFVEKALLFRRELASEGTVFSDQQWWILELDFLKENTFFSSICKKMRTPGRLSNLEKAREYLQKSIEKND